MKPSITLVAFNNQSKLDWSFGSQFSIEYNTESLLAVRQEIIVSDADYILFWNLENELPSEETLKTILTSKGNCWHIGSAVGLKNYPRLLDSIQPTNMLHINCSKSIDHSSWKMSFQALLVKKVVFENTKIASYSKSLDIIGLDFGYNAMKNGALIRYSSILSSEVKNKIIPKINKNDELFFIKINFDKKAYVWSYLINVLNISPIKFLKGFLLKSKAKQRLIDYNLSYSLESVNTSTSIVIATLERYKVLSDMLKELRLLALKPHEIIIVDQTPKEKRKKKFLEEFKDLPIKYLETDKIGQCSSRNLGIKKATSKFVWFLDDDMKEIPSNYLEKHLQTIYALNCDISCGIPDEIGTKYINRQIRECRLSNGFPTNDVLVKKELLINVNGFDEKMDTKQSEDQEIGLRLIKNGALSVKNNQLRILHLRASRGGLRNHNVRKVTFSSSRNNLFERRFIHYSEIYLNKKHYSKAQVLKKLMLNIRGTFIVRGSIFKKSAKFLIGIILLPDTLYKTYKNVNLAKQLLNED